MESKKNIFTRFLPFYGWMSVIVSLAVNMVAFQATRLINRGWHHYDLSLPIDYIIPLVKWFIIIYIPVAYGQWIYGFYLAARERKPICYHFFTAEIVAKLLCLVCFLIIPTTMVRQDMVDTDFLSRWIQWVYNTDAADNLFPSIHCLESYVLLRECFRMERCPKWFKWINIPVTLLVFASTLFLRQHVFVDIIGAIVVVEIGIFVANRLHFSSETRKV